MRATTRLATATKLARHYSDMLPTSRFIRRNGQAYMLLTAENLITIIDQVIEATEEKNGRQRNH